VIKIQPHHLVWEPFKEGFTFVKKSEGFAFSIGPKYAILGKVNEVGRE